MKKLLIILFLLPLLGLGCNKMGGSDVKTLEVKATLDAEQTEWIKTSDSYKEVKPFVASDGKTYQVNSIVKWNGKGQSSTISYEIIEVIPEIKNVTTTL